MMLDKIKELCNSKGLSVNRLEQELGFSQGSIGKMGDSVPKADRLQKIAEYFGVPMEYFFYEGDSVEDYLDDVVEKYKRYLEANDHKDIERPVYRTAAGEGAYNDTYTADSISMGEEGYQYATIVGDSMLPELRDGDVIKIEPTAQTTPRDYTLIKINGDDVTCKFVEVVENGIWVRALNKEVFEDRFYSIQDVLTLPITIIGRAVAFRREL